MTARAERGNEAGLATDLVGRPPSGRLRRARGVLPYDPQWYKDAVIYEVHVRAFFDSDGDGIGDFRGLTGKLDYLADLGVTALWILPFYPSPMRDDGYDIADYLRVNPAYGTLRDVETLIREAHRRGLRIITELVCNHTSDQHPWFQRARRARPGSSWRDYYVWSDTPDRYLDARVIFSDFERSNWSWDPLAGAYYWHRFYSHQPDLNFDNPRVRAEITRVVDFWLDRGVDGLRLDAVPYLFEREGTDCENLPETHDFLRDLRHHVDERYGDRMLLGEANQWPEDAAAYFGQGDECHMAFNFPVMPRMFMAVQMEDRLPIIDIVEQTPSIPEPAQWALFLRNHDELTLEMVTDEERDYMYRVYAADPQARINLGIRRRLAPLLGNHRRRIELMNGLLFSLPGTPVIYYGDEIGMGDNVHLGDRDGVRTPMQWSGDRNGGFSTAERDRLYLPLVTDAEYSPEAVNVAVEQRNPHSLLWWTKRLIGLRKRHPAFSRGELQFLHPDNRHVLAFLRRYQDETVLVVANLSRFFQPVSLDLADYEGSVPVEMFGRVEFPQLGRGLYALTLGPHEFLWFTLEPATTGSGPGSGPGSGAGSGLGSGAGNGAGSGLGSGAGSSAALGHAPDLPVLPARGIGELLEGRSDLALAKTLLRWARERPWYRGKDRRATVAEIVDRIEVPMGVASAMVVALGVVYSEGDPDTYLVPLTTAAIHGDSLIYGDGTPVRGDASAIRIAALGEPNEAGQAFLVDASDAPGVLDQLIGTVARHRRLKGRFGELAGRPGPGLQQTLQLPLIMRGQVVRPGHDGIASGFAEPRGLALELRHALEPGPDPETEVMRYLASRRAEWAPRLYGELIYRRGEVSGLAAIVRDGFLHRGDLAGISRDALLVFLERAAATPTSPLAHPEPTAAGLLAAAGREPPIEARTLIGSYLETARSIGERVAQLHMALGAARGIPDFEPQPFTRLYQDSLFQAIDALAVRVTRILPGQLPGLRQDLKERLTLLRTRRLGGSRMRIHGALTLADVLQGERGLLMIDFEGDTRRPASERRLKRSAIRDVAGMVLSFHYLALDQLRLGDLGGPVRPEDSALLDPWARCWYGWVAAAFLGSYREAVGSAEFLPALDEEWVCLLDAFMVQSTLGDLFADLGSHPARVPTGIRALLELLGREA